MATSLFLLDHHHQPASKTKLILTTRAGRRPLLLLRGFVARAAAVILLIALGNLSKDNCLRLSGGDHRYLWLSRLCNGLRRCCGRAQRPGERHRHNNRRLIKSKVV